MSRTVYYATGQYAVYHEDADCQYIKHAASVRETTLDSLAGMRDPCAVCATTPEEDGDEVLTDGGECMGEAEQVALSRNPVKREVARLGRDGPKPICPDCGSYVGHTKSGGKPLPETEADAFGWSCEDCNLTFPSNCHGSTAPGFNSSMAGMQVEFRDGETRWVPVPARYADTETDHDIRTDGGTVEDETERYRLVGDSCGVVWYLYIDQDQALLHSVTDGETNEVVPRAHAYDFLEADGLSVSAVDADAMPIDEPRPNPQAVTDGGTVGDEADHIASRIREFAKHVDNPDDWMIVVPVDDYNDVKAALDTTKNVGTYYEGIVLCYGDGYDEAQVKLKTTLESYLQRVDTATDRAEVSDDA